MNIRIYNAKVLTMEEGRDIFHGEIQIKGNKIAYVGPMLSETENEWNREIDAKGNVIMPGFKNAHTHSDTLQYQSQDSYTLCASAGAYSEHCMRE